MWVRDTNKKSIDRLWTSVHTELSRLKIVNAIVLDFGTQISSLY